jgi:hypothetical protein
MREGRKKTEHEDKTLPGNASKKIVREREREKEKKRGNGWRRGRVWRVGTFSELRRPL